MAEFTKGAMRAAKALREAIPGAHFGDLTE